MPLHGSAEELQAVNARPPADRRLDSLAWLVQDNDICGAVCFDGHSLLFATNSAIESPLIGAVKTFLQSVAADAETVRNANHHEDAVAFKDAIDQQGKQFLDFATNPANGITLMISNSRGARAFREDFYRSLEKVTDALIASYLMPPGDPRAFSPEVRDAIARNQIIFVPGIQGEHGEMKLAGQLLAQQRTDRTTYLGISKRCCLNCENAIEAVNEVYQGAVQTNPLLEPPLAVRDAGSGLPFPAAIPPFLRQNADIQEAFMRRSNAGHNAPVSSLEEAFRRNSRNQPNAAERQMHRRSLSPPNRFLSYDVWSTSRTAPSITHSISTTVGQAPISLTGANGREANSASTLASPTPAQLPINSGRGRGMGRGRGISVGMLPSNNDSALAAAQRVLPSGIVSTAFDANGPVRPDATPPTNGHGRGRGRGH